jgi:hypothetical protein
MKQKIEVHKINLRAKYGCLIVTSGWFVIKKKTLLT